MSKGNWTDAKERKPTREDADVTGCVLAWHKYNGCMVTGWHQFGVSAMYTHWQRTPEPPEGNPLWENPPGKAEPDPLLAARVNEK